MGPMFDSIPTPDVWTSAYLAVGLVGTTVALLWIRRIFRGEPEPHSFRASASRPKDYLPAAGIIAVISLVILVLLLPATR